MARKKKEPVQEVTEKLVEERVYIAFRILRAVSPAARQVVSVCRSRESAVLANQEDERVMRTRLITPMGRVMGAKDINWTIENHLVIP